MVVIYVASSDTRLGIPDKNRQKESNNITKQQSYKRNGLWWLHTFSQETNKLYPSDFPLANRVIIKFSASTLWLKLIALWQSGPSVYSLWFNLMKWAAFLVKKNIYTYMFFRIIIRKFFLLISWFFSWQNFCPLFKIIDRMSLQKYSFNYLEQAPICKYFLK